MDQPTLQTCHKNMPIRDHNRADTDPASAPFWLNSGMSAKYIKITFWFNFLQRVNLQLEFISCS